MSKPNLILIGAGGHAHACIDVIEQSGQFVISGLIGAESEVGDKHLGYLVIATDRELSELAKACQYLLIAVGQIRSAERRISLYRHAMELGFRLPTIVAPSAHVSRHAAVGPGTIVMHGAIINAGASVGANCIVNTRALVEHDATVGDHCHLSTGAILNGGARLGTGSFVGSGSVVKEGVSIGSRCVIGMGLSVRRDQADNIRFVGGE